MSSHGSIQGFKELAAYFSHGKRLGCFVDTSVLFSQTYPLDAFNEESEQAFEVLAEHGVSAFTNINVRAEFLENHRRVLIAECLIDILESWGHQMDGPLTERLKSHKTHRTDDRLIGLAGRLKPQSQDAASPPASASILPR